MAENMGRTLLLVDDEENILRALKRLLRRDGYTILTANSGSQGLELLQSNEVGVIISDQRMPEMCGVEFLSQVKEKYPNNVRLVLSGYTDLNSVTDAINEGAIFKFLTKPWDDDLLRTNVRQAFEQFELADENKRLGLELEKANEELSRANIDLEKSVKQISRMVDINQHTLQIAQEVLENFPMGVLGIGDDGTIAIANLKAHELLWLAEGAMVGRFASEALPAVITECYQAICKDSVMQSKYIELNGGRVIEITTAPLGRASNARGSVMVLSPVRDAAP